MSEAYTVIGLSDSRVPLLCDEAMQAVRASRIFAGGERHRTIVGHLLSPGSRWITIAPPMAEVLHELAKADGPVVVFTSGDPLFYGFGATLQNRFPDASFRYFPSFSSLQLLAHRIRQPYQTMRYASLTGRSWQELDSLLIEGVRLIGVLTDKRKTPSAIARRLLEYNFNEYSMVAGEALGGPEEQVNELDLVDATARSFHDLNCVILRSGHKKERLYGIADTLFEGLPGRPDMMTKMPVRLATLSLLNLVNSRTFWDIGFCTGSVSIEARLLFPRLEITAFEKRPECEGILERNCRRLSSPGIRTVMGDFLSQNPDQFTGDDGHVDAAFIGGHGGRLEQVFDLLAGRLSSAGRIVVNAVLPRTLKSFHASARRHSFELLDDVVLTPGRHNPITIATAVKP